MLLGRTVWIRGNSGWESDTSHGLDSRTPALWEHLSDRVSRMPSAETTLIFEPDGLAHEEVETPKVNRALFAQLARVRSEHPVVASEDLGWGIEEPESAPGGSYSTLIHHEMVPGLAHVLRAGEVVGSRIPAAWSLYTAASVCLRDHISGPRSRIALVLVADFVAVAASGAGKRMFKAWSAPMSDRDWKGLAFLAGEFESRKTPLMAESELRRSRIGVFAEGDPTRICPIWSEIKSSGRLEALLGLDALAEAARRISVRHPANLLEAFPRPLVLDRYLSSVAIGGIVLASVAGVGLVSEKRKLEEVRLENGVRAESLARQLANLAANKVEMASLRNEAPDSPGFVPGDRNAALQCLAEAVPDSLTLTSFSIARDDSFEVEALLVANELDGEGVRKAFVRCGFTPGAVNGWSFDAATRRLSVRGKFGEPRS
jgi:hypothetical protein